MKLTMAELIERSKPGYVHTITQEQLDKEALEDHHWLFPGVDGPGRYTWNEVNHIYELVEDTPADVQVPTPESAAHDFDRGFGIGGLGRYEEPPTIPTIEQIERLESMEARARYCRRCGQSDVFDGAMFTTDRGSGYCDDCYG